MICRDTDLRSITAGELVHPPALGFIQNLTRLFEPSHLVESECRIWISGVVICPSVYCA